MADAPGAYAAASRPRGLLLMRSNFTCRQACLLHPSQHSRTHVAYSIHKMQAVFVLPAQQ